MTICNKYGAMMHPFGNFCADIAKETAEKILEFCEEYRLTPEETLICFYYVQSTLASRESEARLRKAMQMKADERARKLQP